MPAEEFAARTFEEIVADMAVPRAVAVPYATYRATAEELRPLIEQVAQMAGEEEHQLVATAEYLHRLLDREPLRSHPMWEPQRVVLGLFLLGLTNALARVGALASAERTALRPAYHRDAVAAAAQLDPTFMPPPEEEEPMPATVAAPTDDDADFALL